MYAFQDQINGLSKKYNTNVPIAINDIENFIEILNNAAFSDFDSLLDVVRGKTEYFLKLAAREILRLLDHDRNSKIDNTDIKQTWKKIKQSIQDRVKLNPGQSSFINDDPVLTVYHLMSLVPLHIAGRYLGFWGSLRPEDFDL